MKHLALSVLAVAIATLLSGCGDRQDATGLILQGNVDVRQVALAFDENGRISEMLADEGQQVKQGEVIGRLDTETLRLQAAEIDAQIEVQRQNVLRMANGTRPEELVQLRARVAAAAAETSRAQADYGRISAVSSDTYGRAISAQDVDHARKALAAARARQQEAEAALRLGQRGPRSEDRAAARAQLKSAEAQHALIEHRIGQGVLLAPQDGVIRSRLAEVGDIASAQTPVYALALADPKWVRVYVNEPDLGRIRPGMAASVISDSQPDQPVGGTIGYISSVAEFTPKNVQTEDLRTNLVYEVRVNVEDSANRLRLGQPVTVHIKTGGDRAGNGR